MRKQDTLAGGRAGIVADRPAVCAVAAAPAIPAFTTSPAPGGGTAYSLPVQTLLLMTALSFLPAMLLMMTSFTRIIIVLSLLRQALGTADRAAEPGDGRPGAVPDAVRDGADASTASTPKPTCRCRTTGSQMGEAMDKAAAPLKGFMLKQTRQSDLALFAKISRKPRRCRARTTCRCACWCPPSSPAN